MSTKNQFPGINKINRKTNLLVKTICLLVVMTFLAGGLMTAVNYVSVNPNIRAASLEQIGLEGYFPEVTSLSRDAGNMQTMSPTALELATDALMLKMALYDGEGAGIRQAFWCYSTHFEEDYSRYWHGYVVPLRLLLTVFDYHDIRILNGIVQMLLIGWIALLLFRRSGLREAAVLITGYLLLMPPALAYCLQYSTAFYSTYLSLLVYLLFEDFWKNEDRALLLMLLTGGLTIFLDLMTYPLLSWGILMTFMILHSDEDSVLRNLRKVVLSALFWVIGYGGLWIGKWLLGSAVLGRNLFTKAFSEAAMWMGDGSRHGAL